MNPATQRILNLNEKKTLKVAIVGAGPAGCTLARLLLKNSIQVTVFEGEKGLSIRAQGGTLDLHTETGQKALKEAGLFDEFLKYARFDGEALSVVDKHKTAVIKMGGTSKNSSRGRPEIDRVQLRQLLVESLPEGVIQWGKRLRSVDPEDLSLHFDDGTEKGFDLLVGADGAWSKVRPILSSVKPYYAGLAGVDMVIEKAEEKYPHISKFVNRGSIFAFSDGKSMSMQQRGDECLTVYAWSPRDENWMKTCGYDVNDHARLKKEISKEYADWDPLFQEALRVTDDKQIIARSLYMLPVGHEWEARPGVTLIGDAAHLMTPFAGEGVNLAMEDALELAHAIIASNNMGANTKTLNNSVRLFEANMFRRAAPVAEVSRLNMEDMFFTPGAPQTAIAPWVRRAIGNGWLIRLLLPLWFLKFLLRWIFWW